jgi:putative ABC transport system ATP-binding protein
MVTHELDIARYAKRNIVMRDGQILTDTPVAHRLNAAEELPRLHTAQQEVHLTP